MDDTAQAFGFKSWPFRVVVDEEFAHLWADRAEVLAEIQKRLRRLASLPHSTVQLVWADFGAGKSHSLRHIEVRSLLEYSGRLVPFYTETPVGGDGLGALYRQFASAIVERLSPSIIETGLKPGGHTTGARDLRQAMKLLGSDDTSGKALAMEWLLASPGVPNLRTLKSYGIGGRIEDDVRRLEVIREFVRIVRTTGTTTAVVWLIDEFQRVADTPSRKREALMRSMSSLVNSCPVGLHLVLSISAAQQSAVTALLPPDLRSRASTFPMLTLPYLDRSAATAFVRDLFGAFHSAADTPKEWPLTADSLTTTIERLDHYFAGRLTPRIVMEKLGEALFQVHDSGNGKVSLPLDADALASILDTTLEVAE